MVGDVLGRNSPYDENNLGPSGYSYHISDIEGIIRKKNQSQEVLIEVQQTVMATRAAST